VAETKAQADDAAGRVPAKSKKRRSIVRAMVLAAVLLAGYGLFLLLDDVSGWSSYRQGRDRLVRIFARAWRASYRYGAI